MKHKLPRPKIAKIFKKGGTGPSLQTRQHGALARTSAVSNLPSGSDLFQVFRALRSAELSGGASWATLAFHVACTDANSVFVQTFSKSVCWEKTLEQRLVRFLRTRKKALKEESKVTQKVLKVQAEEVEAGQPAG